MRLTLLLSCCLVLPALSVADVTRIPYNSTYEAGFGRDKSAKKLILKAIDSAKLEVLVAADAFTDEAIAVALINASKRGASVMVIVGEKTNVKYGAAQFLSSEGVAVRMNGRYATQKNSFVIVDNDTLVAGALNFTTTRDIENALLIQDAAAIAQDYAKEWHAMWAESVPISPTRLRR